MIDLQQYVGDRIKVEVDCTDHKHEVEVKVEAVVGEALAVEPQDDWGFCSMRDCFMGWMTPSDEVDGLTKPPLVGTDDDGFGLAQL